MAEIRDIILNEDHPHYNTLEFKSPAAEIRGKKNQLFTDGGDFFPQLFSKSAKLKSGGSRSVIQRLEQEFRFLEALDGSGVTPKPIGLKYNKDNSEAHLLMTRVPGESIERINWTTETAKAKFDEVVAQVHDSLSLVHSKGVLLGDVNAGSFVIDGVQDKLRPITVSVIDFEQGCLINNLHSPNEQQQLLRWYEQDIGVAIKLGTNAYSIGEVEAKKIEQYLAAKAILEHYIGPDFTWQASRDQLSDSERERYDNQYEKLQVRLNQLANEDMQKDSLYTGVQKKLTVRTNTTMANITLPHLLKQKGINSKPETLTFLQSVLNPFIEQRSF